MPKLENKEDRFIGAVIGGAIGDALGMPAENMSAEQIVAQWGSVQAFCNAPRQSKLLGLKAGQITDDTQLMVATMDGLLRCAPPRVQDVIDAYVALAKTVDTELWTGDRRLVEKSRVKSSRIRWIDDYPVQS